MNRKFVLSLDIGSSSCRLWLFDCDKLAEPVAMYKIKYAITTTVDGGATLDAELLRTAIETELDRLCADLDPDSILAVGCATFAGNVFGLDSAQQVITPVWTWADTRAAEASESLRYMYAESDVYQRTGCPIHSAYLPARLRWIKDAQPDVWRAVKHWVTIGEYLTAAWTGEGLLSFSLAAWNGVFNRVTHTLDSALLDELALDTQSFNQPRPGMALAAMLSSSYAQRWPALAKARWGAPIGDGWASNVGCGGVDAQRVIINVGTSGALRVILPAGGPVPPGLWRYALDADYELVGGAISNGGNVVQWCRDTFNLPAEFEPQLAQRTPGQHQLIVLPTFAGERSPSYRDDVQATLHGLTFHTTGLDVLHALMEATAVTLAQIYAGLVDLLPLDHEIICSGGALHHSPSWCQMICDAIGKPIQMLAVEEATVRGAAFIAREMLNDVPPACPPPHQTYMPNPTHYQYYQALQHQQAQLFDRLYPEQD